eukprot:5127112-Pyramimonas_sp.AAC.1
MRRPELLHGPDSASVALGGRLLHRRIHNHVVHSDARRAHAPKVHRWVVLLAILEVLHGLGVALVRPDPCASEGAVLRDQ